MIISSYQSSEHRDIEGCHWTGGTREGELSAKAVLFVRSCCFPWRMQRRLDADSQTCPLTGEWGNRGLWGHFCLLLTYNICQLLVILKWHFFPALDVLINSSWLVLIWLCKEKFSPSLWMWWNQKEYDRLKQTCFSFLLFLTYFLFPWYQIW